MGSYICKVYIYNKFPIFKLKKFLKQHCIKTNKNYYNLKHHGWISQSLHHKYLYIVFSKYEFMEVLKILRFIINNYNGSFKINKFNGNFKGKKIWFSQGEINKY